ncbi:SDR family NAD(P)-dependent oxidoreductase [Amycolatopsis sp. NPDC001319]|uniref:SDR family NAD(P)-dependent oxidoreductase n=1 Tax=unclassified Amycolatopsis TaxID=2618356 RepID=UPI0036747F59
MTISLQDKVALVTGGSRGVGRGIALRLARDGADIAFSYVNSKDQAESLVDES